MIKVSVLFPRREGMKFNIKYYGETHLPMLRQKLGDACKGVVVDRGVRGSAPDVPAPFVVVTNLMFENLETFQGAFRPNRTDILADIQNFSNVQPLIQVSEINSA
jgi:uncharacterized protein (TIGR02118 family)